MLAVNLTCVIPCQECSGFNRFLFKMGKPSRPSQMADREAEWGGGCILCLEPFQPSWKPLPFASPFTWVDRTQAWLQKAASQSQLHLLRVDAIGHVMNAHRASVSSSANGYTEYHPCRTVRAHRRPSILESSHPPNFPLPLPSLKASMSASPPAPHTPPPINDQASILSTSQMSPQAQISGIE